MFHSPGQPGNDSRHQHYKKHGTVETQRPWDVHKNTLSWRARVIIKRPSGITTRALSGGNFPGRVEYQMRTKERP
jgi:hypothetical protein